MTHHTLAVLAPLPWLRATGAAWPCQRTPPLPNPPLKHVAWPADPAHGGRRRGCCTRRASPGAAAGLPGQGRARADAQGAAAHARARRLHLFALPQGPRACHVLALLAGTWKGLLGGGGGDALSSRAPTRHSGLLVSHRIAGRHECPPACLPAGPLPYPAGGGRDRWLATRRASLAGAASGWSSGRAARPSCRSSGSR